MVTSYDVHSGVDFPFGEQILKGYLLHWQVNVDIKTVM